MFLLYTSCLFGLRPFALKKSITYQKVLFFYFYCYSVDCLVFMGTICHATFVIFFFVGALCCIPFLTKADFILSV
jgi:hypothetical protein